MVRSQISISQDDSKIQPNQVTASRSLIQMSNNRLLNESNSPRDEEESLNSLITPKQTLIDRTDLTNDSREVEEIFDRMSFDKHANDILLTKPTQQSLAALKEKRRTVKELMSKFEKN